ncbi:hypothetical protein ACOAM9_21820 [Pseudomonas aeruginosa]
MANQWFRMYAEFATDPKVQMLSEVDQRRYIMLLCLRCGNGDVTFHDDEVAFQLRINSEEWAASKGRLLGKGLITEDNIPANWDKRQFSSDSSTARVAAHRARKKQACNVSRNSNGTKANALDTDTDTDTERDSPTDVGLVDASPQPGQSNDQDLFEPDQPEHLNGHQHGVKPCPAQAIADLYHQVLPELPAVALLNDTRRRHLQARWREHEAHRSLDFWRELFETVKASPFLMGNVPGRNGAKPFRATFDWIIAPSNFVKIVEGNYHA